MTYFPGLNGDKFNLEVHYDDKFKGLSVRS